MNATAGDASRVLTLPRGADGNRGWWGSTRGLWMRPSLTLRATMVHNVFPQGMGAGASCA